MEIMAEFYSLTGLFTLTTADFNCQICVCVKEGVEGVYLPTSWFN